MRGVGGAGGLHREGAEYASFGWKRNIRKAMEDAAQAISYVQRMTH